MRLPTDRERRCLAGGERLLTQVKAIDLSKQGHSPRRDSAARIEIWETESISSEVRITVMEFDAHGSALRSSIFENVASAEQWLRQR